MELSNLEIRFLVTEISSIIDNEYYVSNVVNVSKNSFLFKFHHSTKSDVLLMISTKGIWITKTVYKQFEETDIIKSLRSHLERAKMISISQHSFERIIILKFKTLDDIVKILVLELFGNGNIVLCDANMSIISILTSLVVRHRTLKPGLKYIFPPLKGLDIFEITFKQFLQSFNQANLDLDVPRWLGRTISMPKKFVEEIVHRSNIKKQFVKELSECDCKILFDTTKNLVTEITDKKNHKPVVIVDQYEKAIDSLPIVLNEMNQVHYRSVGSFMEGIDEAMNNLLINENLKTKTFATDLKMQNLIHDLDEQNKAKTLVIEKSQAIRILATALKNLSGNYLRITDSEYFLGDLFKKYGSLIILEKGKKYVTIKDEKILLEENTQKLASSLFSNAKRLESGLESINAASNKILKQIEELKLHNEKINKKIEYKQQISKEWFERYRWFITSDEILAIGGRDASSNSVIIRKHLTEDDIVFHAEIHGSPFFILKKGSLVNFESSITETAIATVCFSRAWKDNLSSGDCYWIEPNQIKKGAPSGQFLPKGSFVIEGKRNYIKKIELKLGLCLISVGNQYKLMCGPLSAVKKKGLVYVTLVPGGYEPLISAKKVKSEIINKLNEVSHPFSDQLKKFPIDEFLRIMPSGSTKIIDSGLGDITKRNQVQQSN